MEWCCRIGGAAMTSEPRQCRTCRKVSGAAIVPWLHFETSKLAFAAGEPAEFNSSQGTTRTFCHHCGAPLTYWTTQCGDFIDVTTCSLDNPEAFPPMGHGRPITSSNGCLVTVLRSSTKVRRRARPPAATS